MRKVILILLVFISAKVNAQVYQEMPQYGYRANRMAFDSTLQIPTVCGVPTLKSIVKTNKSGAIAYDSCNARFYAYNPKTLTWTAITSGSADTTSLSNRINLKIDSLKRSNDSVYAYKNGTRFFQFKDSIGSGGNFWKTSGQTILSSNVVISSDNNISFLGNTEDLPFFNVNALNIQFDGGLYKFASMTSITDTTTYKPLGIDASGQIAPLTSWVSGGTTIDTTNQFVKRLTRTIGKDSIIYFVGANRFAIKDSVGTNPAPVGYYGAFQDNTIQTAAAINTPYAMKFGITDLSNAVTMVSDGSNLTRITIANTGIYNIQFSAQFDRTNSGTDIVDIWLRKNGIDVVGSGGKIVLTGGAVASAIIATWNYVLDVAAGDYYQLMWSTADTHVRLLYEAAQSSPFAHPIIPSTILTVTQQSGIMAGTGISPLDTANMLSNYARTNLVNTKLNISDTTTMLSSYNTRINGKLNISDTASLSNRINLKQTDLDLLQTVGYGIKAEPYGCTYSNVTSTLALTSTGISFYPFNWNVSDSIRGIAFFNRLVSLAVTPSNYNGVAIYSLSGGTLTRLTFTANSGTFWDGAANTWKTQAITPFFLAKGTYYLGYQASAASGLPTIASGTIMQTGFIEPPSAVNTNGVKISSVIVNNTTTPPSSVAMSATTTVQRVPYFILY